MLEVGAGARNGMSFGLVGDVVVVSGEGMDGWLSLS